MRLSSAFFVGSGLAVLLAAMPFISVLVAGAIATAAGCELNEGGVQTCLILGFDAGPTLYMIGVAFWLFIFTWLYLPIAVGLVVAAVVVLARSGSDPTRNPKVGSVFWLLFLATMILPVDRILAFGLALMATFFWWRRKPAAKSRP
jgi:hypothetical protein